MQRHWPTKSCSNWKQWLACDETPIQKKLNRVNRDNGAKDQQRDSKSDLKDF
jgi:hypothetical protein